MTSKVWIKDLKRGDMPETNLFLMHDHRVARITEENNDKVVALSQIEGNRFFIVYANGSAGESGEKGEKWVTNQWCAECFKDLRKCEHLMCLSCREEKCKCHCINAVHSDSHNSYCAKSGRCSAYINYLKTNVPKTPLEGINRNNLPSTKMIKIRNLVGKVDAYKVHTLSQLKGYRFFVVYEKSGSAEEYFDGGKYGETWCESCFKDLRHCSHPMCPRCHGVACECKEHRWQARARL